jgi:hypothetical protein
MKLFERTRHEYPPINQVLASAKERLTMLASGDNGDRPVAGHDDESQTIEESEQPDIYRDGNNYTRLSRGDPR